MTLEEEFDGIQESFRELELVGAAMADESDRQLDAKASAGSAAARYGRVT